MASKDINLQNKLDQTLALGLEFENNVYYAVEGNTKEGPYCSCCYDFYDKLVHLHSSFDAKEKSDVYICPKCKTKIIKEYKNA